MRRVHLLAFLAGVLLFVVMLLSSAGHAGTYCNAGTTSTGPASCISGGDNVGGTPFDICAFAQSTQSYTGAWEPMCAIRKASGTSGTWQLAVRIQSGSYIPGDNYVVKNTDGDDCYNTAWSTASTTTWSYPGDLACSPCPEPMEWNSDTFACEEPDCDEGDFFDPNINACRIQCDVGDFYNYAASSCREQCKVGEYLNATTRDWAPPPAGSIGYVNGCRVAANSICQPDTTGASPTGATCTTWYEYDHEEPEDPITQEEGSGYTGEVAGGTTAYDDIEFEELVSGETTPLAMGSVHYVCEDGVHFAVLVIDGHEEERQEMLGGCTEIGEVPSSSYTLTALRTDIQETTEAVEGVQESIDTQGGVLEDIQNGIGELMAMMSGDEGGGGGGGGSDTTVYDPEVHGELELPEGGDGYDVRYPGGVGEAMEDIDEPGDFASYFEGLSLNFGSGDVPECLSWTFVAPFVGEFDFTPPCEIWNWIAALLLSLATFTAWRIIFG